MKLERKQVKKERVKPQLKYVRIPISSLDV